MKSIATSPKFRLGGLILLVGLVLTLGLFILSTSSDQTPSVDLTDTTIIASGTSSTGGNPGRRHGMFDPDRSEHRDRMHRGSRHDHFNKDTHGNIPGKPSQVLPGNKGSDY